MTQIGPGPRHNGENTILCLLSEKDTKVQRTTQDIQKGQNIRGEAVCFWQRRLKMTISIVCLEWQMTIGHP